MRKNFEKACNNKDFIRTSFSGGLISKKQCCYSYLTAIKKIKTKKLIRVAKSFCKFLPGGLKTSEV